MQDYIGMFAVTAGLGMDKLLASYEAKNDDYGKIMAQVCARPAHQLCTLAYMYCKSQP
jgi:cobalamin-dependent methionine synthase I